jgi:nicotinic acid mononucleotide adenylyltransferase
LFDKNNVYLVVYGRPNYEQSENKYENVIFLYDTPMNDISSTEIREILKKEDYNNKRLNDCLIEEQIKYIKENGLYTNN